MENKNLLHTEQVSGPTKSFFLDLKKTENGKNYLVITQSRRVDEENRERTRIILFENEIAKFSEAMMRSLLQFSMVQDAEVRRYKSHVQEQFPKAYSRWSTEDEMQLKNLFEQGHGVEDLTISLERNAAGVMARLKKLGLIGEEVTQVA